MDILVIVAIVIGVALFLGPRIARRRQDAPAEFETRSGMMSWWPAWLLFGAMSVPHDAAGPSHDAGSHIDGGSHDWSGGHDVGGGGGGDVGGSIGGGGGGD